MLFDFTTTSAEGRSRLLHATVVPRPIGWVLSLDKDDRRNMAPFSFFNVIDPLKLDLIARMHGSGWYVRLRDLFGMKRLTVEDLQNRR